MRLDEIKWHPPAQPEHNYGVADVGPGKKIRVVKQLDGCYGIYARMESYQDLCPLTAQAVLYHLLSPSADQS